MQIPDWRILSIIAMLAMGVYNVAFKKFFLASGDWRVFLPAVGIAGFAALIYFAFTYKEIQVNPESGAFAAVAAVAICIATLCTLLVYAHPESQISITAPIFGMATIVSAALALKYLAEPFSIVKAVGILFGLISIILVSLG